MTVLRWLGQPAPHDDESLAGYLGRWARSNALISRRQLLQVLELRHAVRIDQVTLEKLAARLGLTPATLYSLAPSDTPIRPGLRRSMTRARDEAVCPCCLREASYSRQIWSHLLATACPDHKMRLVDRCAMCRRGFSHDRGLPHLCECGADLRLQQAEQATAEEVEFAGLLAGRVPATPVLPFGLTDRVPAELDLFMLGVANHICGQDPGRVIFKADKLPLPVSVEEALLRLAPAYAMFQEWPQRFDARLEELIAQVPSTSTAGVAKRLGRWYGFLFRDFPHPAFEPLRVAAASRIAVSFDGALNARTHNVLSLSQSEKRWFSVMEAARALRVSRDRVNMGIEKGLIAANRHGNSAGYTQHFLAHTELQRLRALQEAHVDDTTAQQIGRAKSSLCAAG